MLHDYKTIIKYECVIVNYYPNKILETVRLKHVIENARLISVRLEWYNLSGNKRQLQKGCCVWIARDCCSVVVVAKSTHWCTLGDKR